MRSLLQLTRAHTAPLEIVPAVLGSLLATGGQITVSVVLWGVFGLLYHLAGYGHNSVADYKSGYDKNDPHKQHHPMNSKGMIWKMGMSYVITGLILLTAVIAFILAFPNPVAMGLIAVMMAAGLGYNLYGKETKFKFVLIAIAHTSVFALPYISLGGDLYDPVFILSLSYVMLWVVFQIAISGEIKDITTDESNLLKDMGAEVIEVFPESTWGVDGGKTLIIPNKIINLASSIRILMLLSAIGVSYFLESWITGVAAPVILLVSLVWIDSLLGPGEYKRESRIRTMSLIEVCSLVAFCVMLEPVVGAEVFFALVAGSALWLVSLNKIEWGTYVSPKV